MHGLLDVLHVMGRGQGHTVLDEVQLAARLGDQKPAVRGADPFEDALPGKLEGRRERVGIRQEQRSQEGDGQSHRQEGSRPALPAEPKQARGQQAKDRRPGHQRHMIEPADEQETEQSPAGDAADAIREVAPTDALHSFLLPEEQAPQGQGAARRQAIRNQQD